MSWSLSPTSRWSASLAACAILAAHPPARADEPLAPPSDGGGDGGVVLRLTPYAWLTSFNGSINARGIDVDVDASFSDVLDTSDTIIGLMGAVDLEVGRLVFQFNGAYAEAGISNERGFASGGGAVADATVDAEFSNAWVELLAGYRLVDSPVNTSDRFTVDAFGGLRYTRIDADLSVVSAASVTLPDGQVLAAGTRRGLERSAEWIEPFVGARASLALHAGWRLTLRGDVGGFGVDGSSFAWQVLPAIGHEWTLERGGLGVFAGYRALGQDYSSDGFAWDVITHGPLLGLSLRLNF